MTDQVPTKTAPHVLTSYNKVHRAIASEGVGKDRNTDNGPAFNFRSIDDVYNALSHTIADNDLVMLPQVKKLKLQEYPSKNGGRVIHARVKVIYRFVSSVDGSDLVVGPVWGQAFDYGDKAVGKAQSYAIKTALLESFLIPTEGNEDPDFQNYDGATGSPEEKGGMSRETVLRVLTNAAKGGRKNLQEVLHANWEAPFFAEVWEQNEADLMAQSAAANTEAKQ